MHEREAAENGLRCEYRLIDLETLGLGAESLADLVNEAERDGFSGLNITHPCKQSIVSLLTDISEDAALMGAVNTVVFQRGRRFGHNTDWLGFRDGFLSGLKDVSLKHVVQLGAGGGGAATAYALLKMGAENIDLVDPDRRRCEALAERYNSAFGQGRIRVATDIEASLAAADGLVHATPTGMKNHPGMPLPGVLLQCNLWVAEIVYFPLETEFLRAARSAGCRTVDGSGMAVHQAIEAFRLFTGLEADPERMHQHFLAQQRSQG